MVQELGGAAAQRRWLWLCYDQVCPSAEDGHKPFVVREQPSFTVIVVVVIVVVVVVVCVAV